MFTFVYDRGFTRAEYYLLHLADAKKDPKSQTKYLILRVIFLLAAAVGLYRCVSVFRKEQALTMQLLLLLVCCLFLIAYAVFYWHFYARNCEKTAAERPSDTKTLCFAEDAVTVTNKQGSTEYAYEDIDTVLYKDGYYILYTGNNTVLTCNCAVLTGGTAEDFEALLCGKTGKEVQRF